MSENPEVKFNLAILFQHIKKIYPVSKKYSELENFPPF